MKVLISLLYWIFFALSLAVLFFPALAIWLLTLPFDRDRRILHGYTCLWASLYTWVNPFLRVVIEGRENLRRGETYVICANHCSLLDIPLLYRLRVHFKWVSKKEMFRIPFMGWNLTLNGYISLDRNRPSSQIAMMRRGEDYLRRGNSLLIFPEGTRAGLKEMGKFRDGAFSLAKKTRRDVLPLLILGTARPAAEGILFWKKKYTLRIVILPAVSWREGEKPRDLASLTRGRLLSLRKERRDTPQT